MADGPLAHHDQPLARAGQLFASGDSAGALEILPGLVATRPDDIAVRLLLVRCLLSAGIPAVALAAADAAVACDPASWQAHALLARAAATVDPERARVAAERAVALAPHEPEAHSSLAAVQAAAMAPSEAAETIRQRRGGGIGAALGRRPDPAPAEPAPPPRLEPRLPAALDPARAAAPPPPAGTAPAPPPPFSEPSAAPAFPGASSPAALVTDERAPSPVPPSPAAPEPAAQPLPAGVVGASGPRGQHHLEPRLPSALGGGGRAESPAASGAADEERASPGRLGVRVVGLLFWLVVGFRMGVQVVGGPVGFGVFALIVVGVALATRRITVR